MSEKISPLSAGRIEMHVQRHDAHMVGHLTPEGRLHARQTAEEKVKNYLDKNPDTNFMVVASDQVFDEDTPGFGGIRAKETANEIIGAIKDELKKRGLSEDRLFGSDTLPIVLSPTLREANIFSNNFMGYLRERYPEDKPWDLYYQDVDPKTRQTMGAESPKDLALRMDYLIKTAEMVGASFHKTQGKEHSPLVVWIVGHGGGLDTFLHQYANVPLNELGFALSGGFTLRATPEEGVVAEVKGKQYPLIQDESFVLPKRD